MKVKTPDGFCVFCSCLSQHFRFSCQVISAPVPRTATRCFVCAKVSGLGISAKARQAKEGKGGQRGLDLEGRRSCDWNKSLGL